MGLGKPITFILAALVVLAAAPEAPAALDGGALRPLACAAPSACPVGAPLEGPRKLAAGPGSSVIVPSSGAGPAGVATFDATGGTLVFGACFDSLLAPDPCGAGRQLAGLTDTYAVAVSPDGADVYAAANAPGAVSAFRRDPSGALTPNGCIDEPGTEAACTDGPSTLVKAHDIAVAPDGRHVYVAVAHGVLWFTRGADGKLTYAGCAIQTGEAGCALTTPALTGADALAVTDAHVYAGTQRFTMSEFTGSIVAFSRDAATGALTGLGCLEDTGPPAEGCGAAVTALKAVSDLELSPDGAQLYSADTLRGVVATFARDAGGGLAFQQCLEKSGAGAGCAGTLPVTMDSVSGLAASRDGKNLYVTSPGNGVIAALTRASDGTLGAGPGCVQDAGGTNCLVTVQGLAGARFVSVGAGGSRVYATGEADDALVALERGQAPSCFDATAGTRRKVDVVIALACADPNGDALRRSIVTAPKHGSVTKLDQATGFATYHPFPTFSGTDTFTFKASDGSEDSAVQSVTVTVGRDAAPVLTRFRLSRLTFRAGSRLAKVSRAPGTGTDVRFWISERARMTLTFDSVFIGRNVTGRCNLPLLPKRGFRCYRYTRKGSMSLSVRGGSRRIHFQGRLSRARRLAPGLYRLRISGTDSIGQKTRTRQVNFKLLPAR